MFLKESSNMMYKKSPGTCCTADGIKGIAAGSMALVNNQLLSKPRQTRGNRILNGTGKCKLAYRNVRNRVTSECFHSSVTTSVL